MLEINCTANGLPTPTVQWFRGHLPISPIALRTVVYPVVSTHPQCHLVYICVAVNNAGNMTHRVHTDITVNIIGNYMLHNYIVVKLRIFVMGSLYHTTVITKHLLY